MGAIIGIALVWFIIEMLLWVLIAQFISGWYVFFWFIAAAVLGVMMIKSTISTLNPMAQQMKSGIIPASNRPLESTLIKSVATGLAGLLLLLPGLLTDAVALVLLIPFVQKTLSQKAKDYAMKNQDKMMAMMAKQMGGASPFGGFGNMGGNPFGSSPFGNMGNMGGNPFGGTTVDGKATPVKPKTIQAANDDKS